MNLKEAVKIWRKLKTRSLKPWQKTKGKWIMAKILIAEDDKALNDGIVLSLGEHDLLQAYTLAEAQSLWDSSVDLVILDMNLPDGSGLDFCRQIRQTSSVPIVFLTANDMEIDIVTGLESGADDYITKPFSLMVLRARIHAALRRQTPGNDTYKKDGFVFDFDKMIFSADGQAVELSKTEQRLLKVLTANAGITLSREMLMDRLWQEEKHYIDDNALSVAVNRLRSKLPGIPVRTVYGIGYIWDK